VPGIKCSAIWSLLIVSKQAAGLQFGMYVYGADRTNDGIVGEGVPSMPTGASAARETMVAILPYFRSADAFMGSNERCSQPQANCNAQLFITQTEAKVCAWQRVEPGA